MAYSFTESRIGMLQIANVDTGVTPPNQSTAIPTPPATLGMIARAYDPTYGEGEFILLPGVASLVVGNVVTYSPTTFLTTLVPSTANLSQPLAVAMAANTSTTAFSWYQISGLAVVKKTAVKVDPAGTRRMYISGTAGRLMQTSAAGKNVLGCASSNTATVTSTTSTVVCSINRPHAQGPIT
jgi:hypothetical protein